MMQATVAAGRRVAVAPSRANRVPLSARRMIPVRAQAEDPNSGSSSSTDPSSSPTPFNKPGSTIPQQPPVRLAPREDTASAVATEAPWLEEIINGRAAMLGFVAAVVSEVYTHQAVWSQVAGRWGANGEMLESPHAWALWSFGATVVIVTLASLAPKIVNNENPDSRSFGPFTPRAERNIGRLAAVGFLGLVLTEVFKAGALFG